jgi:hypothetical protein
MENSVPLAEGIVEAEQNTSPIPGPDEKKCLNCDTPLTDTYCAHCGQKDIPVRQTIGDLLINFISSFWSFESKFFQTVKYTVFKPGALPRDYNEGKRERYFHPARMYVFISFVYFLLIAVLPDKDASEKETVDDGSGIKVLTNDSDNNINFNFGKAVSNYKSFAQYDSAQKLLPEEARDGRIKRFMIKRSFEINSKYQKDSEGFTQSFGENFEANVPRVFFVLLPIFALILKGLYARKDYYYSEHLIFTVYFYNFFFAAGSIYMLMNLIPYVEYLTWAIIIWIAIYMPIGMRAMYRQPWGKTILKYSLFVIAFSICIVVGLLGNLLLTFMIL